VRGLREIVQGRTMSANRTKSDEKPPLRRVWIWNYLVKQENNKFKDSALFEQMHKHVGNALEEIKKILPEKQMGLVTSLYLEIGVMLEERGIAYFKQGYEAAEMEFLSDDD